MKIKKIIIVGSLAFMVLGMTGCDAFVRKFTRKPRKDKYSRVRPVLVPKEYKPDMTPEEIYRQHFLFWKGWMDELIQSLTEAGSSFKKQGSCVEQARENLLRLRVMMLPEKQQELDVYIGQLSILQERLTEDPYGTNRASNRLTAERIKMGILRDFSYDKIKDYLV